METAPAPAECAPNERDCRTDVVADGGEGQVLLPAGALSMTSEIEPEHGRTGLSEASVAVTTAVS